VRAGIVHKYTQTLKLLQEANVAFNALIMIDKPEEGYEIQFLKQLEDAADAIVKNKLKVGSAWDPLQSRTHFRQVITDAGSLNPKGLATKIDAMLKKAGHSLKVAYILGDDVTKRVPELQAKGETFQHLESKDRPLTSWGLKVLTANAYIGAKGIVAALKDGAEIIIVGFPSLCCTLLKLAGRPRDRCKCDSSRCCLLAWLELGGL
jgi:hypothetical protein